MALIINNNGQLSQLNIVMAMAIQCQPAHLIAMKAGVSENISAINENSMAWPGDNESVWLKWRRRRGVRNHRNGVS
jgi:hypothetical protein